MARDVARCGESRRCSRHRTSPASGSPLSASSLRGQSRAGRTCPPGNSWPARPTPRALSPSRGRSTRTSTESSSSAARATLVGGRGTTRRCWSCRARPPRARCPSPSRCRRGSAEPFPSLIRVNTRSRKRQTGVNKRCPAREPVGGGRDRENVIVLRGGFRVTVTSSDRTTCRCQPLCVRTDLYGARYSRCVHCVCALSTHA